MSNEPKTKTEGFDSLVSEKEFEAIKELYKAFKNLHKIHNEESLKLLSPKKFESLSSYAKVQYLILVSMIEDISENIIRLYSIHSLDKECIDYLVESDDSLRDIKDLEWRLMFNMLAEREKVRQNTEEVAEKVVRDIIRDLLKEDRE